MSNISITYHAEWWVPAKADPRNWMFPTLPEGAEQRYTGNLMYDAESGTTLELYIVPSRFNSTHYFHNDVLWGADANGNLFTLFNVEMKNWRKGEFSKSEFSVGMILIGEHMLTLDDTRYGQCIVKYPYLRKWAFDNRLSYDLDMTNISFCLTDQDKNRTLVSSEVRKGLEWKLNYIYDVYWNDFDATIKQDTYLLIKASEDVSIRNFLDQTMEFSQFLSIALFCEQSPNEVTLVNKENGRKTKVLFTINESKDPHSEQLIKYDVLSGKLPKILKSWHEQYERVSPIAGYLIQSLNKGNTFDVPDFLIIAQALDGYHKRFVNKKGGKDHQKYEDGIKILISQFDNVDCVKKCNIDPVILKDSRNFYSHLSPDEEKKSAVNGDSLFWLTEKCKVLLTCCILNMIGLTNKEINLCCKDSPISHIIGSLPLPF